MKKVSRSAISKMSFGQFLKTARDPYRRLLGFLKPYRRRFLLGLLCGAIYGLVNGLMVLAVNHITGEVLPKEEVKGRNGTSIAESFHPSRELPPLRAALAAAKLPSADAEAAVQSYTEFRSLLHERQLLTSAAGTGALAKATLHPSLPAEYRLLLAGEREMVSGPEPRPLGRWDSMMQHFRAAPALPAHLEKARASWHQVLALPEAQRRNATIPALYFLARTSPAPDLQSQLYSELRTASTSGAFADPLHLSQSAPEPKALPQIIGLCLIIPGVMLLRAIFGWLNSYCLTWVSLRVLDDIRTQLFRRVLGQSMEFFAKQKAGDLVQTVVNQTRVAQQALTSIAGEIIKEPISILSALVALLIIDPKFTLMALVLFPLCIVPVVVIGKKVRKAGADEENEAGAMGVILQEAFSGIREVKSYSREGYEAERFSVSNKKMLASMLRWRKALEAVGPMVEVVASLGIAGALVYVWFHDMPAGKFIALNGGLIMLYPPAKALSRIPLMLQKCLAATSKVFDLMDRETKVPDPATPQSLPATGEPRRIIFSAVDFHYKKETPVLHQVSLDVAGGQTVALVGRSGAGKTTLFSLLLRFYDPVSGSITIDGVDIRDLRQAELREEICVVSQDVFLFHDTIYENIRYGHLKATRAQIEEAARRAHAHDFIIEQKHGYETVIGDRGSLLSGGQRQRISIARAFLKNAPILLLDEATSALDTESERFIQEDLAALSAGKTVLVIAHRLSTVINSDAIVVMEQGRTVDAGPHGELLERCELYRQLHAIGFTESH